CRTERKNGKEIAEEFDEPFGPENLPNVDLVLKALRAAPRRLLGALLGEIIVNLRGHFEEPLSQPIQYRVVLMHEKRVRQLMIEIGKMQEEAAFGGRDEQQVQSRIDVEVSR